MSVATVMSTIKRPMGRSDDRKASRQRCGLCGSARKRLMRTACCGNWICDDEGTYVLFSYARNSCARNHRRYTLCGFHRNEQHKASDWRTCKPCRRGFEHEMEMYVWYGTNEYNFVKLEHPPTFKPTYCGKCGARIVLPHDEHSVMYNEYRCAKCPITEKERKAMLKKHGQRER